ncbi:MAG: lysylphosphatidylglycerol synthase transmembrane domain-containing protein [Betaproteobacteria bacterium]
MRRWWPWLGALVGAALLAWVLRRLDLDQLKAVLARADLPFLLLVPFFIAAEQWVRAWKWRQLLFPMRPIGTLPLFGAIMAGYLTGMLIPFGFAMLARAWLVARREGLKVSAVFATVALDRLTDGIVFALLVPIALLLVAFPDPTGNIYAGLAWGAAGSLVLFGALLLTLVAYKREALRPGDVIRLVERLPPRIAGPIRRVGASFAAGISWPHEFWRGLGIVLASVLIKLLAATHFFWAGLGFGVTLRPAEYLFLIVFLGFLVILGHFARIAGSFIIGAIFALGLLGISEEQALAMVLVVQGASLLTVSGIGALALWRQGVALADLRPRGGEDAAQSG